ncbi:MAG: alpha/beta fold hydrolase [Hyphomicrobium sp.]|nr:alpha/beta fold hydrolase [Hyphomicrobium sp.]
MRISVQTSGGDTLHGIHIPPMSAAQAPRTLVLGFGGNAWNSADVATLLHQSFPQADIVVFHYRGYRPSTGSPSAAALLADAPLIHDFAVDRVKPKRTIAVGFSIGSGIAASLAGQRPLDGLVLVTPFDSLKAAVSDLYPWLPVATFFEHELDTAVYLKDSRVPVALIAGERDTLIRPARTQALRRQVSNLVFDHTIAGAGHNDLYHRPDFQPAMDDAYNALLRQPLSAAP